jgi:hypothetical protein
VTGIRDISTHLSNNYIQGQCAVATEKLNNGPADRKMDAELGPCIFHLESMENIEEAFELPDNKPRHDKTNWPHYA